MLTKKWCLFCGKILNLEHPYEKLSPKPRGREEERKAHTRGAAESSELMNMVKISRPRHDASTALTPSGALRPDAFIHTTTCTTGPSVCLEMQISQSCFPHASVKCAVYLHSTHLHF